MNLYNKILNEVYLIQDFDSWDDSESDFKKNISSRLTDKFFVYNVTDCADVYCPINIWSWRSWPLYEDKIILNGKRIDLSKFKDLFQEKGEYNIIIEDLESLKDCKEMFLGCRTLIKVPYWYGGNIITVEGMFYDCNNLKTVPFLDIKPGINKYEMFYGCLELDQKTRDAWKVNPWPDDWSWEKAVKSGNIKGTPAIP